MEVNEEAHRHVGALSFDCGWSLLSHGAAEIKGVDLGILTPIYERELDEPHVHQVKWMWNVSMCGEGKEGCGQSQQQGGEPIGGDEGGARGERGGRQRRHWRSRWRPYVASGIETDDDDDAR
jgi:hypothetical protein